MFDLGIKMKMKNSTLRRKLLSCLACLNMILLATNVYAEVGGWFTGRVFDSTTSEAIGNVPIYVGSSSVLSTADGFFLIILIPGLYEVRITATGYEPFTDQVTLTAGGIVELNIPMVPIANLPENIAYPQKSYGNFAVSWSLVNEASAYILERATYENFSDAVVVYHGAQNSFIDGGLENGIYFYRVCSENNDGRSGWRTGPAIVYGDYVHKAIIIAGWYTENDPLWEITKKHCDDAHRTLLLRLFDEENITYLTKDAFNNNRDADSTKENIQSAITNAQDADELFIYMHDHGAREKFYLDGSSNNFLSPSELDGWMDGIQPETGVGPKIILVIEACYSGSFIDDLISAGSQERIIITSTSKDQVAWFSPTGLTSFSSFFWSCVQSSQPILSAYNTTTLDLYDNQAPQIDSDGDGIPNEDPDDGDLVADLYVGFQGITGAIRPIVNKVSVKPRNVLNGQTSAIIEAEQVFGPNEIDKVWAVIYPPGFSPNDIFSAVINIPTIELVKNGSKYEGTYNDFGDQGTYTITVIALDVSGYRSDPNTILAHQRLIAVVPIFNLLLLKD